MPSMTAWPADALLDIGFSQEQANLYRALIAHPGATMPGLAQLAGIPPAEVAEVMTSLMGLGVARPYPAAPTGITLVNPAAALAGLAEQLEESLLRRQQRVAAARTQLAEFCAAYSRPDMRPGSAAADESGIERLDSVEAVRERLEELSFFTRYSVYSVQPGGPQTADSLRASRPLDLRGLRRGIDMRIIHEAAVLDDEMNRTYLLEITAAGANIRLTTEPIERFIVMDKCVAVLPIDPAQTWRGALIVQQPGLLTGLLALFYRLWADSWDPPWVNPGQGPDDEPSQEDRQVLQLLASGTTDDTVARQIGVSVRQLRRRIARLMNRLDAHSRFAAGAAAARRGWI
jgi:sugar-specific transcriptional regulator TrmB/DNA-binding CsgD family transcriptional regulator